MDHDNLKICLVNRDTIIALEDLLSSVFFYEAEQAPIMHLHFKIKKEGYKHYYELLRDKVID